MNDNPLVAEIREARKEILDQHHGDFREMMRAMEQGQWRRNRSIVRIDQANEATDESSAEPVVAAVR